LQKDSTSPPDVSEEDAQDAPIATYRELDADLKEQIRETILRERAFEKMGAVAEKAYEFMMERSLEYSSADPNARTDMAAAFADRLKEYAEKNGLEYKETKPMNQTEFLTDLNEQIGNAVHSLSGGGSTKSVTEEVFEMQDSGRGYRLAVYTPQRADMFRGSRYSYWKIKEIPPSVADFKDEAVQKKVLESYRFEQARPLAEKRAKDVVELMKKGESNLVAALEGQTINGTPESPALTIKESPRFSWLRLPESLPQFSPQRPVETMIPGIGQPGFPFFKTVFEELGNNETGMAYVAANSTFYVVRVHDRDGSGVEGEGVVDQDALYKQFLKERFSGFLPTPYDFFGSEIQQMIDGRWREAFQTQQGIQFEMNNTPMTEEG